MRDTDSSQLIDLIGTCWAEFPGCILDVDAEEQWLRAPATAYAQYAGEFWVADDDGEVVGSAGYRPVTDAIAEMKGVYVSPVIRRQGLASVLVKNAEQAALTAGFDQVQAWSDTRFTGAHVLYERLGYRRTGRSRRLEDLSDSTEIEFTKPL
ncbi:GNAT family N-acetyltransferase [Hoyosella sp. YIM 151337]|uniref:GNAT family N-acetyltransferase n=1 Tax=Hoyosella sp. YIM 151337 TaxID=2992742 RepID=UPI002235F0B9|nr:GNAT family N-acetyltransferase [Hoyosella sp. YIM 151337]MCW4352039.1 GNAT family N-acetyltransferase [Hoyosella sp. YIM 151337]